MANQYFESLQTILSNNALNHEYTPVEQNLVEIIKECGAAAKDVETTSAAMRTATDKFEAAINNAWKMVYLIPQYPLEDTPEKWVMIPDSHFIGSEFRTSPSTKIKVEMVERHVDTVDGTPGCIYRLNGNTKLAFMLYGNTIVEYKTSDGENMELANNYSCACFINQFPFTVPYPSVTTIIHAHVKAEDGTESTEDYGFISDIRNLSREEISAEDLSQHFYSPKGTALYPNLTVEEAQAMNYVEPAAEQ